MASHKKDDANTHAQSNHHRNQSDKKRVPQRLEGGNAQRGSEGGIGQGEVVLEGETTSAVEGTPHKRSKGKHDQHEDYRRTHHKCPHIASADAMPRL